MSLTIDDATDRLAQHLAALMRVDKIEAIRVALVNELRLSDLSATRDAPLHRREKDGAAERDTGSLDP